MPKAYTAETLPTGYRLLSADDLGKTFGVDLDVDIIAIESYPYFLQEREWDDVADDDIDIVVDLTVLTTSGVGEVLTIKYGADEYSSVDEVLIKKNEDVAYYNGNRSEIVGNVIISMTQGETVSAVGDYSGYHYYFYDQIFYVKDIEVDEELIGYRALVDGDIGKKFGLDLDCKIFFKSGLSVPIYENDTLLVDWVFPDSFYMFELRTTPLIFDGNNLYERFNYFQGGDLLNKIDIMTTYSYVYDINDETNDYYITDYTLPLLSYINDIYYDYAKDLILVKDLDLTDEEIGYINGYDDGKRDYGGFLDGQWYTAEDYGAWEYNRGLSDSIDVVGVMVGGVFSSLTALGNVEILPGLKIFYVVGIFVVFGVVGFIIQKKFGGDD